MERRLRGALDAYSAMVNRANDSIVRDEVVLAWCRERIDIPEEPKLPRGRVSIATIKEHHRVHYRRYVAITDATMRAYLEAQLMTIGARDLH